MILLDFLIPARFRAEVGGRLAEVGGRLAETESPDSFFMNIW